MEDLIEVSMLLDNYGCLLTEKQFNIMSMYYYENLSLTEISELTHTSRQAAYDLIKRCNKQLYGYEKKLSLKENLLKREQIKKEIIQHLDSVVDSKTREELTNSISRIREKIMRDL